MSVRDLLTFNLFLQLTDGLVSYQAFALGAAEANPVVAAAILNWKIVDAQTWPTLPTVSAIVLPCLDAEKLPVVGFCILCDRHTTGALISLDNAAISLVRKTMRTVKARLISPFLGLAQNPSK